MLKAEQKAVQKNKQINHLYYIFIHSSLNLLSWPLHLFSKGADAVVWKMTLPSSWILWFSCLMWTKQHFIFALWKIKICLTCPDNLVVFFILCMCCGWVWFVACGLAVHSIFSVFLGIPERKLFPKVISLVLISVFKYNDHEINWVTHFYG